MATHSSILAWRIQWTEEPGGLQLMGSQRIRHDWSNLAHKSIGAPMPKKKKKSLHHRLIGAFSPNGNPVLQCRPGQGIPTPRSERQLLKRTLNGNNFIPVSKVLLQLPRSCFEKLKDIYCDI